MDKGSGRGSEEASGKRRRKRRAPMKADAASLRRWALRYLDRYAASASHLRRLMDRKIAASARAHGTEPEAARAQADTLLTELIAAGILNDRAHAEQQAGALRRRGLSRQAVIARLAAKGLDSDDIQSALGEIDAPSEDPDLEAAVRYVRRRRLGAYRRPEERLDRRDRDLAALARQGFGHELAREVIDSDDPEALVDDLTG